MKEIGTFGNYTVREDIEDKKMFVPKTVIEEDGTESVRRIPVRRFKRYLQLTHNKGDIVVFSIYNHAGSQRFKDSRYKQSHATPEHAVSELRRLLDIDAEKAKALLGVKETVVAQ